MDDYSSKYTGVDYQVIIKNSLNMWALYKTKNKCQKVFMYLEGPDCQ